jgi:amino acid adenylation domain-containing protein
MSEPPVLSDAKRALLAKMMSGGGGVAAPVAAIQPRAGGATIPLSADQRQIWLHAAMAPDAPLYNESITIHRLGSFDFEAMRLSLDEILRRHESWRTGFAVEDGELVQHVRQDVKIPLGFDDVSHLLAAERDAAALAIGAADARRAIDLGDAPLFRACVVKLADDDHRIYLTLHHIIFDGVSIYRVVVPELAALYEAYSQGKPSPLPEPMLQYGDYAVWQAEHLSTPPIQRQIETWRRTLADAPAKLELAGDRARPAVRTYAGSMEVFTLPLDLTEALKGLSRREGVTLYMTLLAAFKAMLLRYTGAEDIIVGGVTDLRRRPELERVVGYFLNTIALRSRLTGGLPFRAYLRQVRDTVLGALGASEVPFDEVVRALDIRRQPGAHPLFNVLFSIEPPVDPFPPGWDLTQMDVVVGAAKFDLYLELDERPDGMIGRFLYSTELFDAATIRRMIGHWLTMLAGIVADPDARLGDLPMLTPGELAERARWNETARDLPTISLPAMIAGQVPDAVAIRCGDRCWTYAELEGRANGIAARLLAAGVAKGALVAIAVDRSPEMVAGLLAILKIGAAYLPLDPGFPAARLDHIVRDARPVALLTGADVALPDWSLPTILVDAPAAPAGPTAAIDGDDLAYVLHTSGSTGQPKGVEISHRALTNLLLAMRDAPGFTADDRLLAVTTLSFDIAMLELLLPLICGGELVIAPRETVIDPPRLAALIRDARPTVMQATPATWRALIAADWAGQAGLRLLCGGEALPRDLADALIERADEVWNMYGPTETTIWSLVQRVRPASGPVPIGRPIANTTVHILDRHGSPVPAGVIGELHIGGAGLAGGYRNRPDLTAERFVERDGERLYRTGDLARFSADGTVFCLGRTDAEEKVRGYRIAVEEIEGALATHPAIAAAAVRSWPDPSGERALAAYLVGKATVPPSAAELRAHLAQTLPDYMIPARFDYLPALPMTPNAKIDRNALPRPRDAAAPDDAPAPRGAIEERLAAIWREILGVRGIGRHDSFFDLGGHSLLVAKLLRRVERDFGRTIGMAAFFRAHHLDAMACLLASDAPTEADNGLVPLQPRGERQPLLWLDAGPTFLPLSQEIGMEQPFFGVPVDPILEREIGRTTAFEDIAGHVVAAIRQAHPHGPYLLGGWCTSGILAYEVARQLRDAGEDVPLLVLAHSMNPIEYERIGGWRLRWSKLLFHASQLLRQSRGNRLGYIGARIMAVLEEMRISRARTAAGTHGALRAVLDRSAYAYRPRPYPGDVLLFQPSERVDVLDAVPGWSQVVGGRLETHEIVGGHRSMLQYPHVAEFGALVRAALERARRAPAAKAKARFQAAG